MRSDELFDELYGVCYTTVSRIIEKAIDHPVMEKEIREIIGKYAFGECIQHIENHVIEKSSKKQSNADNKNDNQYWNLITKDGRIGFKHAPSQPLTLLQKRWLKAISLDPRMKLFGEEIDGLDGIEPLFTEEDYLVFDKYNDGDPYSEKWYIENFRLIMDAIENKVYLRIKSDQINQSPTEQVILPKYLEYSEKDDKFRLIGDADTGKRIINLARIVSCEKCAKEASRGSRANNRKVEFEVYDEKGALERVLLHFAHFEKQVIKSRKNHYKVTLVYDKNDEKEMVIRMLSFGPWVKVLGPDKFVDLMKHKLFEQKNCEH